MSRRQRRRERMVRFADEGLGYHCMTKESPSRTWTFQRVTIKGPQWCPYGFKLTWTPGAFHLTGDLGEVTLVHHQAITNDLRDSLHWLYSDFDYLAGKSTLKQEYDQDATADSIWERVSERAVVTAKGYRDLLKDWRADCQDWIEEDDDGCPMPERPSLTGEIDEPFHKLASALNFGSTLEYESRSAWRRALKKDLIDWVRNEGEAADLSYELFQDSESIRYEWPENLECQLVAMRFAANWILKEEFEVSWTDRAINRIVDWSLKRWPMAWA